MDPQPTTVSSSQTFFIKCVFPPLWIGGFAAGTIAIFTSRIPLQTTNGAPADPALKWIFMLATIAGAAFIWWSCMRLKRVRMDYKALYISNYTKEITVPLRDVAEVTENRWVNIHPVTIHFHSVTEFGESIVFMPKTRIFVFWSSHPVVEEIQQAANVVSVNNR